MEKENAQDSNGYEHKHRLMSEIESKGMAISEIMNMIFSTLSDTLHMKAIERSLLDTSFFLVGV